MDIDPANFVDDSENYKICYESTDGDLKQISLEIHSEIKD